MKKSSGNISENVSEQGRCSGFDHKHLPCQVPRQFLLATALKESGGSGQGECPIVLFDSAPSLILGPHPSCSVPITITWAPWPSAFLWGQPTKSTHKSGRQEKAKNLV